MGGGWEGCGVGEMSLVAVAAGDHDEVKELEESSDHGGDVGESGGVEDFRDGGVFGVMDEAELEELLFGAAAGVVFDWEGDDLEEGDDGKDADGDADDFVKERGAEGWAGEVAEESDPDGGGAGEGGDGDECHADFEWGVGGFVLEGVAGFVGGDAEGGDGAAVEIFGGEAEGFSDGIVMVGEVTWDFAYGHTVEAGVVKDVAGGLSACGAAGGAELDEAGVGGAQFKLGVEAQQEAWEEEEPPVLVDDPESKHNGCA
jgi:hypothetical protein